MAGPWLPVAAADEPAAAMLRTAHLSPDTPALDVALTPAAEPGSVLTDPGPTFAVGLGYGDVTAYREIPAGTWAVSVRAAGAPAGTPPVLSLRVDLGAGTASTVAISGSFADLALDAAPDDLSPPPAGSARVRVLAAATTSPTTTVTLATGQVLVDGLPFAGRGPYVPVAGGSHLARVPGTAGEVPLELTAGSVVTVLALDAPDGGTTLRAVLDAAGPAQQPVGGVEAGGGPPASQTQVLAVLCLLAAAGAAALHRRGHGLPGVAGILALALPVVLTGADGGAPAPARVPVLTVASATVPAVADPVRLRIAAVGIEAPLTGASLDGGAALLPPADAALAGWFTGGPRPGEVGPAVVTGHVDWSGRPGALDGLAAVEPGDEVLVDRTDGTVARFSVTRVERHDKAAFPGDRVYAPTPAAELRLITCGGPFDHARGGYRDNVVVWARQVT